MMERVHVTAAEAACGIGLNVEECLEALRGRRGGVTPLADRVPGLHDFAGMSAGVLRERGLLKGRRYGAASNAAVRVAAGAVRRAGWTGPTLHEAWLFAASSRGNVGEILRSNAWRRPVRKFSASNTMHSEIAAAVSIELGIRGPWQMCSNGCSSGLDALGMAWMAVAAGLAPRALVVAVDLPLVADLLRDFRDTGLLSLNGVNDPFALGRQAATSGFLPGEAAVAVTLERETDRALCRIEHYAANSDASDALMIPEDGGGIADCVKAVVKVGDAGKVVALCPHATGTINHARVEPPALLRGVEGKAVPLIPLKPHTGHALGASGLLDVALLAACLGEKWIPAVLPGLTPPACGLPLNEAPLAVQSGDRVIKLASGMGGHNAAVSLAAV
ncbi:MAG: hypothetical protein IAE77_12860 [Prosthecobacter sp.]|jgi:3-oxoacyl-(acyl-carrier-protein) synthase|uniref:beta-ketoacyl synthase N-terminal-like domain-containing protein n=1 Tax=Prosthecobacter sp. TaxID=1965333 RepID=UPI0019EACBCE|nr:beta-ketoacyl synthase N-terminal-like domain-containing protein [Prosthecobacter sp.]MBE2284339.1 hypothetical protein [Prosthecobacter sp.]